MFLKSDGVVLCFFFPLHMFLPTDFTLWMEIKLAFSDLGASDKIKGYSLILNFSLDKTHKQRSQTSITLSIKKKFKNIYRF